MSRPAHVVDCEVHCRPGAIADLFPYMDEAWASFAAAPSLAITSRPREYPPALGGRDAVTRLDELSDARDGRSVAILSCTAMDEIYRNPAFAARAVNDWLRAEWLDRDPTLRAAMVVSGEDVEDAVAEIERLGHDDRFVQVLLPVRNDVRYGTRRFHRCWRPRRRTGRRSPCTRGAGRGSR